jgi:hypothetical protein
MSAADPMEAKHYLRWVGGKAPSIYGPSGDQLVPAY